MYKRIIAFLFCLLTLPFACPLLADGIMIPSIRYRPIEIVPSFSVKYHRVKVTIDQQVATTEVDQAFHNNAGREIEGTYIFPIADGMSISKFSMYTGGEELTHRVLAKEEARTIYNNIVRQRRDPALLEWVGTRMIQASVFPIAGNEDKRVRLSYQEVLRGQDGVVKYVYPLKTEKMSATPLEECSVDIDLRSPRPIRNIYSPTHAVTIQRDGEFKAHVHYSATHVLPDQDLELYYTVSENDLGVNLLTYSDPEHKEGYFLLLAAPKVDVRKEDVQPKDVVFVLDTSGSMSGQKLEQAKKALNFCVNSLDHRDRFNIIAFSSDIRPWQPGLEAATTTMMRQANDYIDELQATGGTNINGALQTALKSLAGADRTRPKTIIFLTDGLPTVGETDNDSILAHVHTSNTQSTRVFCFGVGADYNAHFLDKLANANNGFTENVLPKEDLEVKVSSFYTKMASPLLLNLNIDWGGMRIEDCYPQELPDLFINSQLIVVGRYKPTTTGQVTLTLSGDMAGKPRTFKYPVHFASSDYSNDFIPRLWATRKIGMLEDALRLNGTNKEVLDELIALSKKYGILTEYTSFLVDMDVNAPGGPQIKAFGKPELQTREAQDRIDSYRGQTSGMSGVTQAMNRHNSIYAPQAASGYGNIIVNGQGEQVQLTQMRNISQRSFVQNGSQWIDINYKPSQHIVRVKAFSPAYFQLANAHPRMAQYMSMSDNVTVAVQDEAIEIGSDGQDAEFNAKDFSDIQKKMNTEFGAPTSAIPLAMIQPPRQSPFTHPITMLLLIAISAVAVVGIRLRSKSKKHREYPREDNA